jgi:hypothetical protein
MTSGLAIANQYFGCDPDHKITARTAQRILAGGSRRSGGLFHVHEFAVSPHCWCRVHVVGRLVAKEKANRFLEAERLVHRLAYNGDVVAFKMGRRQGARRAHISIDT